MDDTWRLKFPFWCFWKNTEYTYLGESLEHDILSCCARQNTYTFAHHKICAILKRVLFGTKSLWGKVFPLINGNSRNQDMLTLKRIGFLQVLINKFRPFNLWHWGLKGRQIIAHCFEHEEEYKITQYYIFLIHRLSSLLSSLSKWSPPSSLCHCRCNRRGFIKCTRTISFKKITSTPQKLLPRMDFDDACMNQVTQHTWWNIKVLRLEWCRPFNWKYILYSNWYSQNRDTLWFGLGHLDADILAHPILQIVAPQCLVVNNFNSISNKEFDSRKF